MEFSKLYFPKTSSFCQYDRFVAHLITVINTYDIESDFEIKEEIKTLRKEPIFNYNQYSNDASFEFKLFDNQLHYNSYNINYNSPDINCSINFSRSTDFPYGMVQFDCNSGL